MIKKLFLLLFSLSNTNFLNAINFKDFYHELTTSDHVVINEEALWFLDQLIIDRRSKDLRSHDVKASLACYFFSLDESQNLELSENIIDIDGEIIVLEANVENIPLAIQQAFLIAKLVAFIKIRPELETAINASINSRLPKTHYSGSINKDRMDFDNACRSIIDQSDELEKGHRMSGSFTQPTTALHIDLGRKGKDRKYQGPRAVLSSSSDGPSPIIDDRPVLGTSPESACNPMRVRKSTIIKPQ